MNELDMIRQNLLRESCDFIEYLADWKEKLPTESMAEIIRDARGADHVAIISVDVIEGFCRVGPLASDRIKGIIAPVVNLFKKAHQMGVRHIALSQDAHREDSREFQAFPPHCIQGTREAQTVEEFKALPFFEEFDIFTKNSISSSLETGLGEWLNSRDIRKIIVVGDCTDLCANQLATFIRHLANTLHNQWEVILPENCVQTYDLPVKTALEIGAPPHPGDFFHLVFLYHMSLEGIRVVSRIE